MDYCIISPCYWFKSSGFRWQFSSGTNDTRPNLAYEARVSQDAASIIEPLELWLYTPVSSHALSSYGTDLSTL
jgi:hypothetical protein